MVMKNVRYPFTGDKRLPFILNFFVWLLCDNMGRNLKEGYYGRLGTDTL